MSNHEEFEKRADNLLRAIERADGYRNALRRQALRSTAIRRLDDFAAGDPIVMTLLGEDIGGVRLEDGGIMAGRIIDPSNAIINVRYTTTDMPGIVGEFISLAADTKADAAHGDILPVTFQGCVAGDQGFAYCLEEDLEADEFGELRAPEDKIVHAALKYARVAIKGTKLFDFITPIDKL